jgi:hypothetical protein
MDSAPTFDDVAATAVMIPLLPCGDVDAMAEFWSALGLEVTYRQVRPNPYVALRRGGIDLHYYGMPGWNPDESHSTCSVVVADTAPVHEAFAAGLRGLYGRLQLAGVPRVTRPRRRANNAGLSGFSLVDPAGNWVRVSRAPESPVRAGEGGATSWTSAGGGPVARATENAVVIADSHGDVAQARKVLGGALRRALAADSPPPVTEHAPALGYLTELAVRAGDADAARTALADLEALAAGTGDAGGASEPGVRDVVEQALAEARAVLAELDAEAQDLRRTRPLSG